VCATAWSGGEGALASLFHLATLGLIQVRLSGSMALKRTRASELQAGENVQTPTGATVSVPTHLATLFNALQPVLPAAEETPFYKIETQFQNVLPRVYAEMGAEATRFFDELPDTAAVAAGLSSANGWCCSALARRWCSPSGCADQLAGSRSHQPLALPYLASRSSA